MSRVCQPTSLLRRVRRLCRTHPPTTLPVPHSLVSSNWGGTVIEAWSSNATLAKCAAVGETATTATTPLNLPASRASRVDQPDPNTPTVLYNAMIYPYVVGPMNFKGITWFQGESNGGEVAKYACLFPAMVRQWKVR